MELGKQLDFDVARLRVFRHACRSLVVLDEGLQPADERYWLSYFVQGAALRVRERVSGGLVDQLEPGDEDYGFAVQQYRRWWSRNPQAIEAVRRRTIWEAELLPDPREPCPECHGEPRFLYTVGSFAEGQPFADGENIIETCKACGGDGYRYILLD